MEHTIKIVAHTTDESKTPKEIGEELKIFSGKAAGICYMPDDYIEEGIQNTEKALKRAESTSKSGHHSVYDHGHISLVIKTSKMICMILNSLGVYTTSEKSARYTKMQPETELELQMYDKWRKKLQTIILEKYPKLDDIELSKRFCKQLGVEYNANTIINGSFSHIKEDDFMEEILNKIKQSETLPSYKLAQENARYMISVFTPTTMMYTISLRQICLIRDYFKRLHENLLKCPATNFNIRLDRDVMDFSDELNKLVGELGMPISDNKNQYIRFLDSQVSGRYAFCENRFMYSKFTDEELKSRKAFLQDEKDEISDSYKLVYEGSLAMLAQAQRHRTLRYKMNLEEAGEYGFYIPPILREDKYIALEWLADITILKDIIPQGTMVRITEQGLIEDFVLKCKERLCGRAQLEIMNSTANSAQKILENVDKLSFDNQYLVHGLFSEDNTVIPRCMFKDFKCSESCPWGAKNGLNRLI